MLLLWPNYSIVWITYSSKNLYYWKLYYNRKTCIYIIFYIFKTIKTKKLDLVRISKYFEITINESTNILVSNHLIVFVSFIKNYLYISVFLDLLFVSDKHKDTKMNFETIM
jgi:hypothetical protein